MSIRELFNSLPPEQQAEVVGRVNGTIDKGNNTQLNRQYMANRRAQEGLTPATFHYQDPTPEMLADPLWNAVWDEVKTWDINVPTEYEGYTSATGNHATAIYLAVRAMLDKAAESAPDEETR